MSCLGDDDSFEHDYDTSQSGVDLSDLPAENSDIEQDSDADALSNIEEAMNDEIPSQTQARTDAYPDAGRSVGDVEDYFIDSKDTQWNPWQPFASAAEFKLARFFLESNTPKSSIDDYFNNGLCHVEAENMSFTTGESFYKALNRMHGGAPSWQDGEIEIVENIKPSSTTSFYYRNVVDCAHYLLRQPCYTEDMIFAPVREYDGDGHRMFSEMHTASWWWDTQVRAITSLNSTTNMLTFSIGCSSTWINSCSRHMLF